MELTKRQRQAVEHDGSALVVANPGTGKTTIIAHRIRHLLDQGVDPGDILCVTFTKKAAGEMSRRLCEMGDGAELVEVKTFHSLAYDYLSGLSHIPEDLTSTNLLRYAILREFRDAEALNYGPGYLTGTIIPKVENAIRFIKSYGLLPEDLDRGDVKARLHGAGSYSPEELRQFLDHLLDAYERYESLKESDALDYTDLLIHFLREFPKHPAPVKHVLVDELQDMNRMEAEIARLVASDSLFLVGDRKQAIFGFQGGSVENFELFDFPTFVLLDNWRSRQEVLDYARDFFLQHVPEHRDELEGLRSGPGDTGGEVHLVESEEPEKAAVKLAVELGEAAIVARTNYQIRRVEDLLRAAGVDYATTARQGVESDAAQDVIDFIRGLLDERFLRAASLTPYSPVPLPEALQPDPDLSALRELRAGVRTKADIYDMFTGHILPVAVSLGEREFRTAQALFSATREYFRLSRHDFTDYAEYLQVACCDFEPVEQEAPVTLTTVHKAKGREFPHVVYLPSKGGYGLSLVDALVEAIMESAGLQASQEEDRRIDFVAMTRAEDTLHVVTKPGMTATYRTPGMPVESPDTSSLPLSQPDRLLNAYSLFLSGDWEAARQLIDDDQPWLTPFIEDYFEKLDHLSFSTVSIRDPLKFLEWKIVDVSTPSGALDFGSRVHDLAEHLLRGDPLPELTEQEQAALENVQACLDELEEKYPDLQLAATELCVKQPITELTGTLEPLNFLGFIDAVFRAGDRYILLDWKTNKKWRYSISKHKKQLAAYRRLFSRQRNVPEDDVDVAVAYVALRPSVNTGDVDHELMFPPMRNQFNRFREDLQRVLNWRADPQQFALALLDSDDNGFLAQSLKDQLQKELSQG